MEPAYRSSMFWCNERRISNQKRMAVTTSLLSTFLANCAGAYSKSALINIAAALQATNILYDLEWSFNQKLVSTMLKGAAVLAEDGRKRSCSGPLYSQI
jgi:hypothetical protein